MSSTLAMLQGLVPNEGDGWEWTLEELQRYFELAAVNTMPEERFPRTHVSFTELSDHPRAIGRGSMSGRIWMRQLCWAGARRRCI